MELPPPDFTAAHVHDLAHRILSQAQFRQPSKSLITRVEEWLARQIDHFVHSLASGGHATLIGWVIIVAALAAAGWLLSRLARRVKRDPGVRIDAARRPRKTPADWIAEAVDHEQAGRWRDALRCRYRALIAELAERGLVDEIPGRTAREYQTLVSRNLPAAEAEFGGASELFEGIWYGNRPSGPAEDEQIQELTRRVLSETGRR